MYRLIKNRYLKSFIICFSLVCVLVFCFSPRKASANPLVVVGGIEVTAAMIAELSACSLIAGNCILDNSSVDSTNLQYIANGLIATGNAAQDLAIEVDGTGHKFLSWSEDGIKWFSDQVTSMISSGTITYPAPTGTQTFISTPTNIFGSGISSSAPVWVCPSISVPSGSAISGSVLSSVTMFLNWSYANSSAVSVLCQYGVWMSNGYSYIGRYINGVLQTSWYFTPGGSITSSITSSTFIYPAGSICTDTVSSNVKTYNDATAQDVIGSDAMSADGSVSYRPSIGIPLSTADGTTYTPSMSIPYGKGWADVAKDTSITYPDDISTTGSTTADPTANTGTLDIPILGDILKVLQKILSFLGTLISSLVTALITALRDLLTKLFVPDSAILTNEFTTVQSKLQNTFPCNLDLLTTLKDASSGEPNFIYSFTVMGVPVTLDLNFIKQVAPYSQMVANGLVAIFLVWYNFRKIIWIIRGTSPVGGDGHTGQSSGGSSPVAPSVSPSAMSDFRSGDYF